MASCYWLEYQCGNENGCVRLGYLARGFPINFIDTHSHWSGGAYALSLAGYINWQIQKKEWWKGSTFKEYIQEELHIFLKGMSMNMKNHFHFVNISCGMFHNVTSAIMEMEYDIHAVAA